MERQFSQQAQVENKLRDEVMELSQKLLAFETSDRYSPGR